MLVCPRADRGEMDTQGHVIRILEPSGELSYLWFGSGEKDADHTLLTADDPEDAMTFDSRTAALSLLCALNLTGEVIPLNSFTAAKC